MERLQYAKDNAEKYKLIIVYDVDAEEPKCMELPMRFWEDSKFRKREIVERIEFEFQVSQKRDASKKQSDVEAYVPFNSKTP